MAPQDSPEYRRNYNRGWRYSQRPTATLDHGDANGEPDSWYDGYLDYATGREKWHLLHCQDHGDC